MEESSSTTDRLEASLAWQRMGELLQQFIAAWDESPQPPKWLDYVVSAPAELRKQLAVELIKLDMEYRCNKRNEHARVEEYLQYMPELAVSPPLDLLFEEYHLRKRLGQESAGADLLKRFPHLSAELRRMIGTQQADPHSTLLHSDRRVNGQFPRVGERLDDFDLLSELGRGAFATVYLAWQRSMQRQVALKITRDQGNEPQTLAQLDHEYIVRVYDQRTLPDRRLRLIYMQYAAGGTLKGVIDHVQAIPPEQRTGADYLRAIDDQLRDRGLELPGETALRRELRELSWSELVCWMGGRLALALNHAQQLGILHRDIKPANVLLTHEGVPKLADFNISFHTGSAGKAEEQFGGSMAYMSPEHLAAFAHLEQQTAGDLDARSDQFSLAVLLCELLTGRRPFGRTAEQPGAVLNPLQLLQERKAELPADVFAMVDFRKTPGLDLILRRCLSVVPAERFADGRELQRALAVCRVPHTQRLLAADQPYWVQLLRRYPTIVVVALCVVPNMIAGALNYAYNHAEIIRHLPGAETVFFYVQAVINGTFFPLGVVLGAWRVLRVIPFVSQPLKRELLSDEDLALVRVRALSLGNDAAWIGIGLWLVGGIAFPLAMHFGLGTAPLSMYIHFFASLLLCGLIAAAYPFFIMSLIVLRCFYPLLIRNRKLAANDAVSLELLRRRSWMYFALAALVPMSAVVMLSALTITSSWAPVISAVGGMMGFVGSWWAVRRIQADAAAYEFLTQDQLPG